MTLFIATFLILFVNLAIASPIPQINESWINFNDFEVNFNEDGFGFNVNIKHNDIYNVWKVEEFEERLRLRGWYNKAIDFILILDIPSAAAKGGTGKALPVVMKDDKNLSGCALKSCAG
ncbi:uncharacterized protein LOC132789086 [Drosophila nasuta]|uniref:uncharacterized protein LOC132789086 n=1 Tax=Drosophila nasuta TaxID=42062 RepID=UPI00295F0FF7|nr:uncharacterized protein LOC132789086 [Drosophila nasuta]